MASEDLQGRTEQEEEIPHPEDCDHVWDMKGISKHGGTPTMHAGFQCRKCGRAEIKTYRNLKGAGVYEGWNPKPKEEADDGDDDDRPKGFLEGIFG